MQQTRSVYLMPFSLKNDYKFGKIASITALASAKVTIPSPSPACQKAVICFCPLFAKNGILRRPQRGPNWTNRSEIWYTVSHSLDLLQFKRASLYLFQFQRYSIVPKAINVPGLYTYIQTLFYKICRQFSGKTTKDRHFSFVAFER